MSGTLEDHTAQRLAVAIREQFPEWAVANNAPANDATNATAASENSEYVKFILASNWVWSSEGLQELSNKLQEHVEVSPVLIYSPFDSALPVHLPFINIFIGSRDIF